MLPCTPIRPLSCLAVTSNVTELVTPREAQVAGRLRRTSAPSTGVAPRSIGCVSANVAVGNSSADIRAATECTVSAGLVARDRGDVDGEVDTGHLRPVDRQRSVDLVRAADGGGVDAEQDLLHAVAHLRHVQVATHWLLAADCGAAVVPKRPPRLRSERCSAPR